ncbi:hypothetical protein QVD17_09063 [Tagetes erecta]|uniref:Uncharacterized protein n=1 Tax=Tagetes erecta TaxID=13708 RepID=A0AAD8L3W5_TARER|nr:hypothetical protein QVD17_09063 [Tagetes erecta]
MKKGKHTIIPNEESEVMKKKKKIVDRSKLDEDVIQNVNTSLAKELSMMKTKLMNLKEMEKYREVEMFEISEGTVKVNSGASKVLEGIKAEVIPGEQVESNFVEVVNAEAEIPDNVASRQSICSVTPPKTPESEEATKTGSGCG